MHQKKRHSTTIPQQRYLQKTAIPPKNPTPWMAPMAQNKKKSAGKVLEHFGKTSSSTPCEEFYVWTSQLAFVGWMDSNWKSTSFFRGFENGYSFTVRESEPWNKRKSHIKMDRTCPFVVSCWNFVLFLGGGGFSGLFFCCQLLSLDGTGSYFI